MEQKLSEYDPDKDPQVTGDPYRTVFVGRLDYSINEINLTQQFSAYGEIDHVRVVRERGNGKSRGYGFVVYQDEEGAKMAFDHANGIEIKGRKMVVDIERGRVVKNWKPKRLGGGLGGRNYDKKKTKGNTKFEASGRRDATRGNSSMLAPPTSSYHHQRLEYKSRGNEHGYESNYDSRRPHEEPKRDYIGTRAGNVQAGHRDQADHRDRTGYGDREDYRRYPRY
ncbi:hypothetical protein FOA43_003389 [Brettanomyces nanus]|uniref:RRM domain-containing protein n=1 Tax=Eeniella nana TaxID=13502 RepID=A0A875S508_EENNA|nr:uncharacterized protein FOA43_003389 [Brettanomyces nanus]QPG76003.1 hypothetical protein FOA43_003389 [Brettanomyces nanus]